MIDQAILVACKAHRGQRDLAGEPYILHPLRVMMQMDSDLEMIVAVLHDVIEDGHEDIFLEANFPGVVKTEVYALSRVKGELYEDYIQRVSVRPIARKVKIADLKDNLNPERAARLRVSERSVARQQKYLRALRTLLGSR